MTIVWWIRVSVVASFFYYVCNRVGTPLKCSNLFYLWLFKKTSRF